ncbi:MAG: hypothetical protein IMZ71_04770, partial [Chloroflexi bacterium]|nr:hypothetical protein [Chloroflexota bacterium]
MAQATFKYLDSVGVVHTQSFDITYIKGLDDVDKVRFVPPILYDIVDGSKETAFKGFQRIITVELQSINTNEDYLRVFLQADSKSITYTGATLVAEECQIVFESTDYENEWLNDFQYTKRYILEIVENTVRTFFPVPIAPVDNMIGYIKTKDKIVGTQATPEFFEINVSKLQYNYGTTVYPTISLLSYNVSIIANGAPYQDAKINNYGDIAQNGDNIRFYLAVSDTGSPSDDGFYYTDIVI